MESLVKLIYSAFLPLKKTHSFLIVEKDEVLIDPQPEFGRLYFCKLKIVRGDIFDIKHYEKL